MSTISFTEAAAWPTSSFGYFSIFCVVGVTPTVRSPRAIAAMPAPTSVISCFWRLASRATTADTAVVIERARKNAIAAAASTATTVMAIIIVVALRCAACADSCDALATRSVSALNSTTLSKDFWKCWPPWPYSAAWAAPALSPASTLAITPESRAA